jgi:hypothetical protein
MIKILFVILLSGSIGFILGISRNRLNKWK